MSSCADIGNDLYTNLVQWTYLCCVALFEVGSLICALAKSSPVFIVGRAIAGLGCAGIMNGGMRLRFIEDHHKT